MLHDSFPLSYEALSREQIDFIDHLEKNSVLKDIPPIVSLGGLEVDHPDGSPTILIDSDDSADIRDTIGEVDQPPTAVDRVVSSPFPVVN